MRVYWFIFRPQTRGVKCIISHNSEILFLRHTYGNNNWNFPGGGIKKGEEPEDAAKREVKEEVGLTLINIREVGNFSSVLEYKKDMVRVFAAEATNRNVKLQEAEIMDCGWYQISSLPEKLSITAKRSLELYFISKVK